MVIEAEEGDVNWAIKLVDGNAELEGSWGSGSIGMGGIVDRVDVSDVVGVGRTVAPGGFINISIFKRQWRSMYAPRSHHAALPTFLVFL